MKNFFRLIAGLAFLVMVSTAFVACSNGVDSSDDGSALSQSASNAKGGSSSIDAAILGTWTNGNNTDKYSFSADGNYSYETSMDGFVTRRSFPGTFRTSSGKVTLIPAAGSVKILTYSVSGNTLTMDGKAYSK